MSDTASSSSNRQTNPLTWLLDRVGSIWFGVSMLVLIFVYSSIGSALPVVREGILADWLGLEFLRFGKSEMEWFSWWPFQLMIGLFCLSTVVVTLRRIPLNLVNAGVWAIHSGIVILAIASAVYFGSKVEGDAVIFQSTARIRAPGSPEATMVIRPQAEAQVTGVRQYQIQVSRIEPNYTILTGNDKGKQAQQIWLNVNRSEPLSVPGLPEPIQSFTRTMLVGYPAYTEDVITGAGGPQRAVKITGEPLLDKELQILLAHDPARYFYHAHEMPVRSNGAIYARFSLAEEWTQLRVEYLPHYAEYLTHRDELWPTPGEPMPPMRKLDEPALSAPGEKWPAGVDLRVTGYLPYAKLEPRYVEGAASDPVNPVVRFRLESTGRSQAHELVAMDSHDRQAVLAEGFNAEFAWASTPEERTALTRKPDPRLKVAVASNSLQKEIKLADLPKGRPSAIEGTDYKVELRELFSGGMVAAHSPDMVLLRVTHGDKTFDRVVMAGDTSGGRDLDSQVREPSDPDIKFEYLEPATNRILLVAGPAGPQVDVIYTRSDGAYEPRQLAVGGKASLLPSVDIVIETLLERARQEYRPSIVPRQQRLGIARAGKSMSLVRVEVNDGGKLQSIWLPFNEYAFPDPQRAQPGRFSYTPRAVRLSDGRLLWLMYSRWRDPLPSPVALDRFVLQTYPGGDRESDFISQVIFAEPDGKWSDVIEIRSNQPAEHGDFWYFQSKWDPGMQAHTILGVGNRRAVGPMLGGTILSIAGMVYAFYVKPAVVRRRKRAMAERLSAGAGASSGNGEAQPLASRPPQKARV